MEEIKCEQVGQIEKQGLNEMTGRVYGVNGLSPSIRTFCGGGQETKILVEPLAYDEQNGYLRRDGTVGTITTDGSSPKHNNRVFEPIVYDGFNGQVRTDSTTIGTITRNVGADLKRNGQGIIEPVIVEDFYKNRADRVYNENAPTLRADREGLKVVEPTKADYRVRKLTEKECFRLQGVKDTDFAKIRKNQSKSSCYHLAGDSITTSVLMALFGQMLGIDWRSKVEELVDELQGE
jgi:DNA (cytosine-5)-methyltransferase 1